MVRVEALTKAFSRGHRSVPVLGGIDLVVPRGQFCSIMGASGSGKSTLLHLIGGLDTATSGQIFIDDNPISALSDDDVTLFRRRNVGFIFQFFHLLPALTVEENVALPLLLDGHRLRAIRDKVTRLLDAVGLGKRLGHRPDELSGGEMQRVAIARALVIDPILLLADEPTGNLDSHTGQEVLGLIQQLVRDRGHTTIMVTHDPKVAETGDRIVTLHDGKISRDTTTERVRPNLHGLEVVR